MNITATTTASASETTTKIAGPTGLRAIMRRDHGTFRVSVETVVAGRTTGMHSFGKRESAARRR